MSQTSWSRKPADSAGSDPLAQPSEQQPLNLSSSTAPRLSSSAAAISTMIPANKGSQRYQLDSVFQVWFDNQQKIEHQLFSKTDDNYKLDSPGNIYHLYLQSSNSIQEKSTDAALADQVNKLASSVLDVNVSGASPLVSKLNSDAIPPVEPVATENVSGVTGRATVPVPGPASNSQPDSTLVQSDKIEWVYVDPSGNEQGPFVGDIMQEWLTAGYLNMDLKIRRKEESVYYSLREYCDKVGNYVQPFKVPLLDLSIVPPPPNLHPLQGHAPVAESANEVESILQQGTQLPQLFAGHQPPLRDVLSQQQQQQQQQPQLALLSQFFLPNNGGLGGSGMRLNSSLNPQGNLFTPDFISNDPFNSTPITQQQTSSFSNQFGYDHMGSGFGMNNLSHSSLSHINTMPSLLQQQIHQQQPVLSRSNSGWGMDINSSTGTPVAVASSLNQINQPAPMSPWLTGVQSLSRVGSPFVPTLTLKDDVLNIHSSVVSDILGNVDDDTKAGPSTTSTTVPSATPNVVDVSSAISSQPSQVIELGPPEPSIIEQAPSPSRNAEPPSQSVQHVEPKDISVRQASDLQDSIPATASGEIKVDNSVISQAGSISKAPAAAVVSPIKEKVTIADSPKPTLQPKLAPWATVTAKVAEPLSLKEIQKLEAEKLEKQKQEQKIEQPKMWELEEKLEDIASSVPLGWATAPVSTNSKPTKTLAEIQKEEAEARAKAARASAAASAASNTPLLGKTSLASTLAAVPKDDGGAWTTIVKKQPPKKATTSAIYTSQPTAKVNPQMLRSASATKTFTSSSNTVSIKEEFLIWARSAMTNLYPTANRDEMLDLFVALPNGSDSSQLIADTIYSSSATMDGRRYAQEFMKRRQKVEAQIGGADDYSWTDAIILSADKVSSVDEDGWSTSTKKKGGRRK